MILVDTNILIALKRKKEVKLRDDVERSGASIAGITLAELHRGVRTDKEREELEGSIAVLHPVETPESVWLALGQNLALLDSKGVVVPIQDAILASLAILIDYEEWSRDNHFPMIQAVLPALKLYQEPP